MHDSSISNCTEMVEFVSNNQANMSCAKETVFCPNVSSFNMKYVHGSEVSIHGWDNLANVLYPAFIPQWGLVRYHTKARLIRQFVSTLPYRYNLPILPKSKMIRQTEVISWNVSGSYVGSLFTHWSMYCFMDWCVIMYCLT